MKNISAGETGHDVSPREAIGALSRRVLHIANRGIPKIEFMCDVSSTLLEFSGCDAVEIWFLEGTSFYRHQRRSDQKVPCEIQTLSFHLDNERRIQPDVSPNDPAEQICWDLIRGRRDPDCPLINGSGIFWTGEPADPDAINACKPPAWASFAILPLIVDDVTIGVLHLQSHQPGFFDADLMRLYKVFAQNLAIAMIYQHAQASLHERVKELTCLYGISRIVVTPGKSLDDILQDIVNLLPPAWQYPTVTAARIQVFGRMYLSPDFADSPSHLRAPIVLEGIGHGTVEVVYLPSADRSSPPPFLEEERKLIQVIAQQVAMIIQRKQAEEEKFRLQEQLRHADRLATIGQLAAGVAHELNEPLGNILGFAQLIKKHPDVQAGICRDVDKIVAASLHAREIVRKLMLFARQKLPQTTRVNLNSIVEDGLYLLEARCAKNGIVLKRNLCPDIPDISADPTQLHQVLVNLVVNAIQAMPEGGRLTIGTSRSEGSVSLDVEDTGIGMSPEIMRQVFIPFFTTKDVDEGTGLGLPVVHGIVTTHGGTIQMESQVGKGSRFKITLPVRITGERIISHEISTESQA